jgi:NarL family two-component system sensor histidine kinase LiaS
VKITLDFGADDVRLLISDDGVGIGEQEPGLRRVGYGMGNLRKRVEDLEGTLRIATEPNAGTKIEVRVPVAAAEPGP